MKMEGSLNAVSFTANSTRLSLLPQFMNHPSMCVLHLEYLRGKSVSPDRWNFLGRTAIAHGLTKGKFSADKYHQFLRDVIAEGIRNGLINKHYDPE